MFCNKCGEEVESGVKFCGRCGNNINLQEEEVCGFSQEGIFRLGPLRLDIKKKKRFIISGVVLIVLICVLVAVDSESKIDVVRDGTSLSYPHITYGDAFANFFGEPEWDYFMSDDGRNIVEFTGTCIYANTEVDVLMQFAYLEGASYFEAVYCGFNGIPQTDLMKNELINLVFEEEFWRQYSWQ